MATVISEHPNQLRAARQKALVAGGIGNFVEWFDFGLYAQFAVIIGAQFFPSDDPNASLLASFSAFAVGFLARPLGGIVFGQIGDRVGRRVALSAAVLLMAGATVAIALTPNYATSGIAAPILLLLWRVLQGASAGGEYAGSSSFVVEYAPPRRRALFGSVNPVSVALGTAAGASTTPCSESSAPAPRRGSRPRPWSPWAPASARRSRSTAASSTGGTASSASSDSSPSGRWGRGSSTW